MPKRANIFDVILRLLPGATQRASHFLVDVNATPMPLASPSAGVRLLIYLIFFQSVNSTKSTNSKSSGLLGGLLESPTNATTIVRQCFLWLPATYDPGGQLDPLLTCFLWRAAKRLSTALPCPAPSRIIRASPAATVAHSCE
jgi:hypothetical protein